MKRFEIPIGKHNTMHSSQHLLSQENPAHSRLPEIKIEAQHDKGNALIRNS